MSLSRRAALAVAVVALASTRATSETVMDAKTLAPGGTLRAAINLGNTVLAGRDASGALAGITVDIARELARRLSVPVALVPFEQAGQVADAAGKNIWDVAFLAIDPKRAQEIAFTAAYVLIEGAYAVPATSSISAVGDVDRAGARIAVVEKSAYDLFLTRTIKHATLVRAAGNDAVLALFRSQKLDVLAGVRQPLAAWVADNPDMRMVPGRFMAIEQAVGIPIAHAAAQADVRAFVEALKASGFIADALARHRQPDAKVAPPANG